MREPAANGILLVDKPQGISSHRVVSIARRRLDMKKIGHAGTLDPMATGLLIVGVGTSTRLLTHLVGLDKSYTATIRLGVSTTTDDADGDPVAASDARGVSAAAIERALAVFRGTIDQVPSTVSAIKVDGRRAYELARKGESVTLRSRTVRVSRLAAAGHRERVVTVNGTDAHVIDIDVVVDCSSGTYVRAVARDVGAVLGTGGHLTALRRTAVGPFSVTDAVDIEDDALDVEAAMMTPAAVARRLFPVTTLSDADAIDLSDGKQIPAEMSDTEGPVAAVTGQDRLIGLVSVRAGRLRVITNFPTGARS